MEWLFTYSLPSSSNGYTFPSDVTYKYSVRASQETQDCWLKHLLGEKEPHIMKFHHNFQRKNT